MKTRPGYDPMLLAAIFLACQFVVVDHDAFAQTISGGARNFVTGVVPVIGENGSVVGGISINAEGVVVRADIDSSGKLARKLEESIGQISANARQSSAMRKISLRKLETELTRRMSKDLPLDSEIEFLAGLQRIEYVFVDAKNKDIIVAGPAEGWRVNANGFVVGETSGRPVIELGDLLVTLRTTINESVQGITCSMDATDDGLQRYSGYLRERPEFNEQTLREMKHRIGNFEVSFTGVSAETNFARILIAADLMMKRLGMNLEKSPVPGVTSYLELLQRSKRRVSMNSMPRWWLATNYKPVLRDEAGLAWHIDGPAVKTMTDEDYVNSLGQTTSVGRANPLAQQWADDFTRQYQRLSVELPVFGQLRNCMDLAVVAALINKHKLFEKSGFESTILTHPEKIQLAKYSVPKSALPQVSYVRARKSWIVTVSGGIDIDGWSVAQKTQIDKNLALIQAEAVASSSANQNWWWD